MLRAFSLFLLPDHGEGRLPLFTMMLFAYFSLLTALSLDLPADWLFRNTANTS
jgi:hypothetical protein